MEPDLTVYWQPGCTSCLRTKEFLREHGIAFRSVNVRAEPQAMAELAELGVASVPVVRRGADFVFGQDLSAVAAFIGVRYSAERLPPALLIERLCRLLEAGAAFTRALPPEQAETLIPGRADRAYLDLGYHMAMIVRGFLDAAEGGALSFEHFERRPPKDARNTASVATTMDGQRAAIARWWRNASGNLPTTLKTYYGEQPLHGVLERTAWHVAQHARQLEHICVTLGVAGETRLSARELDGLPLPDAVWDKEIGAV
jgi:glutaredoxin